MMNASLSWHDLARLLRTPDDFLAEHLRRSHPVLPQILVWFVPAILVRPIAVLLRSLILEAPTTAVVLATSSVALQIGCWLVMGSVLPVIAHQFDTLMRERDGLLLVGFASVPLWLAGALFVVPDAPPLLFWWSRFLVFLTSLYGGFIAYRGLGVLGAASEARWPLVAALAATYLAVYTVLFVLLGLSSHAVLFLMGTPA
jgi:hypothetical protein